MARNVESGATPGGHQCWLLVNQRNAARLGSGISSAGSKPELAIAKRRWAKKSGLERQLLHMTTGRHKGQCLDLVGERPRSKTFKMRVARLNVSDPARNRLPYPPNPARRTPPRHRHDRQSQSQNRKSDHMAQGQLRQAVAHGGNSQQLREWACRRCTISSVIDGNEPALISEATPVASSEAAHAHRGN